MPKPTLLAADPDPRSLRMVELALKKAGFEVETSADGAAALRRLLEGSFDAAVCDAALPVQDGIAVCRAVREKLPRLPLLVIGADRGAASRALEAGADDFLRKPVLLKELVQRVHQLLERRELDGGAGDEAIVGSMRDLGLVDALRSLLDAGRSAVVTCEAYGRTARLWVRDGQLIDAEAGALQGEPALWRLMTWESGAYRVELQPVDREPRIGGGTEAALAEAMRQMAEVDHVSEGLGRASVLAVDYARLAEALADLPDEVNGVVRNFDGKRTLREAIDLSPVDDLSTIEVVRRLVSAGILKALQQRQEPAGAAKKPSLNQWLSTPPPPVKKPPPLSLEEARVAATALVREMENAEAAALKEAREAEELAVTAVSRRVGVKPIDVIRFPPLRGVRRERLRREAEEARARIAERRPVRLSRVVELPAWRPDGSDAPGDARQMSPAVGEAARKFAPDTPVARVAGGAPAQVAKVSARPAEPEPSGPIVTPPIALVAPVATPPIAPVAPETPPPDRPPAAEVHRAVRSFKRWEAIAAAAAGVFAVVLAGAWLLRRPPDTEKRDSRRMVAAVAPAPPQRQPPPVEHPVPTPAAPPRAPPELPAPSPSASASDALYAKALEQGDALLKRGKYRQAIGHFQRAVREKPESVTALLALADAFLEADKPRSALPPLEDAERIDPQNARAQLLLGTAYQSLGRNTPAMKAYRRYLELEPKGEFARDVRSILANLAR